MKKILHDLKKKYKKNIKFAHDYGYQGMIVPLFGDCDEVFLESIYDEDELQDIAYENDWSEFLLFDFVEDTQKIMICEFA